MTFLKVLIFQTRLLGGARRHLLSYVYLIQFLLNTISDLQSALQTPRFKKIRDLETGSGILVLGSLHAISPSKSFYPIYLLYPVKFQWFETHCIMYIIVYQFHYYNNQIFYISSIDSLTFSFFSIIIQRSTRFMIFPQMVNQKFKSFSQLHSCN